MHDRKSRARPGVCPKDWRRQIAKIPREDRDAGIPDGPVEKMPAESKAAPNRLAIESHVQTGWYNKFDIRVNVLTFSLLAIEP